MNGTFNEYIKPAITGVLGAALGITITYSTGVASNREEIVRLTTQVENLTLVVRERMTDRYTGREAAKDLTVINSRISQHDVRCAELTRLLNQHIVKHEHDESDT
jgi:hypothetical protein